MQPDAPTTLTDDDLGPVIDVVYDRIPQDASLRPIINAAIEDWDFTLAGCGLSGRP